MCLTVFVLQKTGLTGFLQTSHMAENTLSAYHLYRKPGNSGENSNGTVHPGGNFPEKSNTFRGITLLTKRPKFSVPFVWISSSITLPLQKKRKMYVRVILQMVQLNPIPVFSAKKNSGTTWRKI